MNKFQHSLAVVLLFVRNALAVDPTTLVFDYEFSVQEQREWKNYYGIPVQYKVLMFRGASLEKVPGNALWYPVHVRAQSSPEEIDAIANDGQPFVGKPVYPPEKPLRAFYFQIDSLQLNTDGQIPLNLRFKDATEKYALKYIEGEGLRLEAIDASHGNITAASFPEFVNLRQTQGEYVWQCNPLTITASNDGKALWSTDMPMQGQPESLSILDKVLYVKTTEGHSFYLLKDTGQLLFYDASVMTGKAPADDIRRIWGKEMRMTFKERNKRGFFRFIKAAALLDDKDSIPLMIECVENGFGLDEKCAAIAALEKFDGTSDLWAATTTKARLPSSYFLRNVGMNPAFPAENAKAERKKWEKVFADYLTVESAR